MAAELATGSPWKNGGCTAGAQKRRWAFYYCCVNYLALLYFCTLSHAVSRALRGGGSEDVSIDCQSASLKASTIP